MSSPSGKGARRPDETTCADADENGVRGCCKQFWVLDLEITAAIHGGVETAQRLLPLVELTAQLVEDRQSPQEATVSGFDSTCLSRPPAAAHPSRHC